MSNMVYLFVATSLIWLSVTPLFEAERMEGILIGWEPS